VKLLFSCVLTILCRFLLIFTECDFLQKNFNQQMKKHDPSTSIDSFTHKLAERNASKKE
jgi:hypothetical protein